MTPNHLILGNIVVTFLGLYILYSVWLKIQREIRRQDKGYLFLARSMTFWSVFYLLKLGENYDIIPFPEPLTLLFSDLILHLINSLLLIAVFFFEFAPKLNFQKFSLSSSKSRWFRFSIITGISFSLLTIIGFYLAKPLLYALTTGIFSSITLIILGLTFTNSFLGRKLTPLAILAAIVFIYALGIQVYRIWPLLYPQSNLSEDFIYFLELLRNTAFIVIFLSAATAWLTERSVIPRKDQMKIDFHNNVGKSNLSVKITVDHEFEDVEVSFPAAQYLLFLKFAVRKKCYDKGINGDDVHSNYIKRIETRIQDENPNYKKAGNPIQNAALKRWPFFFEKNSEEYTLTLDPKNIEIDRELVLKKLTKLDYSGMSAQNSNNEVSTIQDEFSTWIKASRKR